MQQNVGSKSEHQAEEAKFSDKKVSVSTPESPNLQIRKIATHIHAMKCAKLPHGQRKLKLCACFSFTC